MSKWTLPAIIVGGTVAYVVSQKEDDEPTDFSYQEQRQPAWQPAPRGEAKEREVEAERDTPPPFLDQDATLFTEEEAEAEANTVEEPLLPDNYGFMTINTDMIAQQMQRRRKEEWRTSWLKDAITVDVEMSVFQMKAPTAEAARRRGAPDRRIIMIDTWESYRFFGRMLTSLLFTLSTTSAGAISASRPLVEWFNYHDWTLDPNGEVRRDILAAIAKHGGREDVRLWPEGVNGNAGSWDYIKRSGILQKARSLPEFFPGREAEYVDSHDGLTLLLEYAVARYMSMSMAQAILRHDRLAGSIAGKIIGGLGQAIEGSLAAAKALSAGSGRSGSGNEEGSLGFVSAAVVTAAAAVVAGVTKAIAAIGDEVGTWDSMPDKRRSISKQIEGILRESFGGRSVRGFSGHRWGILKPNLKPLDDVKDVLWQHYFFSTPGRINVGPQLPCYYLGIDFDLTWSIACMDHSLVVLHPRVVDQRRLPQAFSTLLIPQSVLKSDGTALDMRVEYDQYDSILPQYRPPACYPSPVEKGWKGGSMRGRYQAEAEVKAEVEAAKAEVQRIQSIFGS